MNRWCLVKSRHDGCEANITAGFEQFKGSEVRTRGYADGIFCQSGRGQGVGRAIVGGCPALRFPHD
jgi:hypothetical protein